MNHEKHEQALDLLYMRNAEHESAALEASRQQTWAALADHMPVAYDSLTWNVAGTIWFAVGARGLVAVQMGDLDEGDFVARQSARLGRDLRRDATLTEPIKQQLREYLSGEREAFDVSIDWRHVPDFQAAVLRQAMQIPAGAVMTYGGVAAQIGKPRAARAVGRALGTNPMPIIIPCHRVIAANGSLTGYIGGLAVKQFLLRLEGYAA